MLKRNSKIANRAWDRSLEKVSPKRKRGKTRVKMTKEGTLYRIVRDECSLDIYVSENIDVYVKTDTVNSFDKVFYRYFSYAEGVDIDLNAYRIKTYKVLKNLIMGALTLEKAPEWYKDMIPRNATEEEIERYSWCAVREGRLLEKHYYNE